MYGNNSTSLVLNVKIPQPEYSSRKTKLHGRSVPRHFSLATSPTLTPFWLETFTPNRSFHSLLSLDSIFLKVCTILATTYAISVIANISSCWTLSQSPLDQPHQSKLRIGLTTNINPRATIERQELRSRLMTEPTLRLKFVCILTPKILALMHRIHRVQKQVPLSDEHRFRTWYTTASGEVRICCSSTNVYRNGWVKSHHRILDQKSDHIVCFEAKWYLR